MKTSRLVALACALLPSLVAASITVTKPVVVVTGDSFSRRSGVCSTTSFDQCEASQQLPQQESYSLYLNSATRYGVVVTDNSARGGDTCTAGNGVLGGLHAGTAKGLVSDVNGRINIREANVVSILIGANDVLLHNRTSAELTACLRSVYAQVIPSGKKIIAMTYPPVINQAGLSTPWGPSTTNNSRLLAVNTAIRTAVAEHNAAYPHAPVLLAETSTAWTESGAGSYIIGDGIHPSVAGARRIATTWFQQVCGRGYIACSN
jgi:lysophospholipase L1-like esterase